MLSDNIRSFLLTLWLLKNTNNFFRNILKIDITFYTFDWWPSTIKSFLSTKRIYCHHRLSPNSFEKDVILYPRSYFNIQFCNDLIYFRFSANNKALASTAAPRFLSRGHTYRAVVGDTLVLPCEVENLGKWIMDPYNVKYTQLPYFI